MLLPNRTSTFELIFKASIPPLHEGEIFGGSKFLPNFSILSQFFKLYLDGYLLSGFEEVVAVCVYMGDDDYHFGNIGIIEETSKVQKLYINAFAVHRTAISDLLLTLTYFSYIKITSHFLSFIAEDPIELAHNSNVYICSLPPIEYALKNGIFIRRMHAFTYLSTRSTTTYEIQGKSPIKALMEGTIEVKSDVYLLEAPIYQYESLRTEPCNNNRRP
jgi:hypothetical protein